MVETIKKSSAKVVVTFIIDQDAKVSMLKFIVLCRYSIMLASRIDQYTHTNEMHGCNDLHDTFLSLWIQALLEEVVRQNITDKQWLANDAWVTYATLSVPQNIPSLAGTLGLALRKADIPNLGYFLTQIRPATSSLDPDPFKRELWKALFGCSLSIPFGQQTSEKPCSGSEVIGTLKQL